ncbi:HNH endonuclease [Streptomyces sp. NPDC057909]|uniref:HNH endonuclease n=1 Tax=Streptomyces sp. NPDC057909 TaxID=3346277 RepID=UPI0036E6A580
MVTTMCLDCHRLTGAPTGSRCPDCAARRASRKDASRPNRPSSHARGYDAAYRRARALVLARQPWCSVCRHPGSTANPLTADHIVPLSRGGTNDASNLRTYCKSCNSRRGNRIK